MAKIDYKKERKDLYSPSSKEVSFINVPEMGFLMIGGSGDPNISKEYAEAIQALYALSYALKFMVKKGKEGIDYGVLPLEGLWWAENMGVFKSGARDEWKWTAMIRQPELINDKMVEEALIAVKKKKELLSIEKIRFEKFNEGPCAQIMYIGPFSGEGPIIEKLHDAIEKKGYLVSGKHHEIYLSDIRKVSPEKMKTVLRQPFKKL
jgi:hypothetical protein